MPRSFTAKAGQAASALLALALWGTSGEGRAAPEPPGTLGGGLTLRSAWLEGQKVLPSLPRLPDRWPAPGGTYAKKRTKKGSKKSSSGNTLEYGALSGAVSPMNKIIGIGVQIGAPTGVTGKVMLLDNAGLQAGIGAFNGYVLAPTFSIYLDGVFHPHVLARSETFRLSWYVGVGLWMGISPLHVFATRGNQELYVGFNYWQYGFGLPWFGTSLAMRVPLGVSLALNILPIEIYGELVPALLVFPAIGGGIGATVGLRFYL